MCCLQRKFYFQAVPQSILNYAFKNDGGGDSSSLVSICNTEDLKQQTAFELLWDLGAWLSLQNFCSRIPNHMGIQQIQRYLGCLKLSWWICEAAWNCPHWVTICWRHKGKLNNCFRKLWRQPEKGAANIGKNHQGTHHSDPYLLTKRRESRHINSE